LHLKAQASSCSIFVAKENHAAALQDVYPTIAPILPSFDVIRKSSFHCGHHSQRLIHSAKIVVRIVATIVAVNPALLLEHKSGRVLWRIQGESVKLRSWTKGASGSSVIAGILVANHMDVADDLFGGPQGSENRQDDCRCRAVDDPDYGEG
jgi:hypothetical protein